MATWHDLEMQYDNRLAMGDDYSEEATDTVTYACWCSFCGAEYPVAFDGVIVDYDEDGAVWEYTSNLNACPVCGMVETLCSHHEIAD